METNELWDRYWDTYVGFSLLHEKYWDFSFVKSHLCLSFLQNQQFLSPLFNQSFCSLFINEITSFKVQNYVEKNGGKALQVEEWRKLYNLSLDFGNDLAQSSVVKTLVGWVFFVYLCQCCQLQFEIFEFNLKILEILDWVGNTENQGCHYQILGIWDKRCNCD